MSDPYTVTCVWCKKDDYLFSRFEGCCSRECLACLEAYQRGRDEERAKALSGADAYLKQAITEATNEAYQRGKVVGAKGERAKIDERNRIADAAESLAKHGEAIAASVARVGFTDAASAAYYAETLAVVRAYTSFAERLRNGEV